MLMTFPWCVQDLLPLVFMFELPILQPIPDVSSSPSIQQIQQTHNVTVTFKQRPNVYVTTVVVRGSVNNAKSVKEATVLLIEHLTATIAVSVSRQQAATVNLILTVTLTVTVTLTLTVTLK